MPSLHTESILRTADGLELFSQAWRPDGEVRGSLALVHGLGEHSGRYPTLVDTLTAAGFAICSCDLRGHGRSPGKRGHVMQWDEYLEDVRGLLLATGQMAPGSPLFLFGHSMGGLIALNYAIRYPQGLHGVIASAPALTQPKVNPLKLQAARALSRIKPAMPFDNGLDATGISRDAAEVQKYQADPLVHAKVSARWATEFGQAIDWTQAHAGDLRVPLLIYHGTADRLVPIDGSRTFLAHVTLTDKQWIEWPDGYHEAHNDLDRQAVCAAVLAWLDGHIGGE